MPPKRIPPVPTRPVRLELFDIQGHNGDKPLDYSAFFQFIESLSGRDRQETIADRVVIVPVFNRREGVYFFSAYMGSPGSSILVVDLANGEEELRAVERGKLVATRTVGVIDPKRRLAVVQYVHSGVRAPQIAALFEKLGHSSDDFEGATLEFAPRAANAFRTQLSEFERIQSVSLTLTRPNYDWSDYPDALNGLAADSNAHNVSVEASASRSQALSKTGGVVKVLRELISGHGQRSILKSAEVKGNREGEDFLTSLKLSKLTQTKLANVELSGGLPNGDAVRNAALAYLSGIEEPK
ncbi:hypothetical protein [Terriglobus roseus]|uniref:Uncharacterized protein n=1 Tax=Terriglobus roseus TaxID=392734 RepID=A0A1H4QQA8_9BACT|nr:hypothetical protein [Terriglobus roseus]SEC21813.1 hypothetical protein SAMN05443244_2935 [Terriglobus roseus]